MWKNFKCNNHENQRTWIYDGTLISIDNYIIVVVTKNRVYMNRKAWTIRDLIIQE